jgi:hypothetical protein
VGTDRDAGWRMGTRSRGRGRRRGRDCRRDHRIPAAGLLGSSYISGRSRDWLKFKNPAAPSAKREAEEEWGKAEMAVMGKNRIMIFGPKDDGTDKRLVVRERN